MLVVDNKKRKLTCASDKLQTKVSGASYGANPSAMAAGWSDGERQLYARRHSSSDQKELTVGRRQPANGSAGKEEVAGRRALRRERRLGGRGNPKAPPVTSSPGNCRR